MAVKLPCVAAIVLLVGNFSAHAATCKHPNVARAVIDGSGQISCPQVGLCNHTKNVRPVLNSNVSVVCLTQEEHEAALGRTP